MYACVYVHVYVYVAYLKSKVMMKTFRKIVEHKSLVKEFIKLAHQGGVEIKRVFAELR